MEHFGQIAMYKPEELVNRKLATLIGREPREKPRDIYDAGWLMTERPELIGDTDRTKLHEWLVVRHVIIFGHGHGLQRAIIDESQHRTPERLIMAQH